MDIIKRSEQINELFAALAKAQGEMESAKKDALNPHFGKTYATLAACWEAARAPLSKNGLSIIQSLSHENGHIFITTILGHSTGQWISSVVQIVTEKNTPQGVGAAITYFRRFSFSAMVGIAPDDDDDANAAEQEAKKAQIQIKPNVAPAKIVDVKIWEPSQAQLDRLFAIAHTNGWSSEDCKIYMKQKYNIDSSKQLSHKQYDEFCAYIAVNRRQKEVPVLDPMEVK